MKLFFGSDLHGSLPATEQMIQAYLASEAQQLILLGDILNHGPRNPIPDGYNPAAVAELLNQYADQIIAVRGNCDSEVDQMLLGFPMLEPHAWVLLEGGQRLFLSHGHVYHAQNRPVMREGDVLVHGHTHLPCAAVDGEQIIYNPGSITFPKGGYPASYGLLSDQRLSVISFEQQVMAEVALSGDSATYTLPK